MVREGIVGQDGPEVDCETSEVDWVDRRTESRRDNDVSSSYGFSGGLWVEYVRLSLYLNTCHPFLNQVLSTLDHLFKEGRGGSV